MKRFIIPACCMMLISIGTTFAQTDPITKKDSVESQAPYESKSNRFFQNDMVLVNNADIPEEIKQTLNKATYKGWESGRMFKSPGNEVYMLEIEMPGKQTRVYRFDVKGKEMKSQ